MFIDDGEADSFVGQAPVSQPAVPFFQAPTAGTADPFSQIVQPPLALPHPTNASLPVSNADTTQHGPPPGTNN